MELQFEDFKGEYAYLNGGRKMNITSMDLCRCTMQVGYKNRSSYISSSLYKKLQLLFMIKANVKAYKGELMLKDAYYSLDQSEKVCVSYQIGQGLTKAIAEKYFAIPWVAHFSTMKKLGYKFTEGGKTKKVIVINSNTGRDPDLVGYDRYGRIHLFESKGKSKKRMPDNSIQKAINQVSNYINITDQNGNIQNFATRNACFFTMKNSFKGHIIDPPIDGDFGHEENAIGYIQCIYNYYYDFLFKKKLKTMHESGIIWKGYILTINNKKIFWGVDSSYINFLNTQFDKIELKHKKDIKDMKMENEKLKGAFFHFLSENITEKKGNYHDDISIGSDGFILAK